MKRQILILGLLILFNGAYAQKVENEEFNALLQSELKHNVPEIDINTLVLMDDFIFIDARSLEEFNASHIKGAIHIDFIGFALDKLPKLSKKQVIVVYCSVGSRSERVTKILIDNGFKQSFNLYGGLFEWSNRGLPLVDENEQETIDIHGVTKDWSKWITRGNIVY